jgi:hypothetical protein
MKRVKRGISERGGLISVPLNALSVSWYVYT